MTHAHPPAPRSARYREIRKVTLTGSLADLALGVVKITFG